MINKSSENIDKANKIKRNKIFHKDKNKKVEENLKTLFDKLKTSSKGLTSNEVELRLKQYGLNEIQEEKINPILKFLSYFWNPISWMIEIAALISLFIHRIEDFFVIIILLILNGIVGWFQEKKADNAIELLKNKLALKARVLRDGKWSIIEAKYLVPGDIIRIRLGDIVPADVVILDDSKLIVDQSILTGESLTVTKGFLEKCFSGSIIKQGESNALVIATSSNTFFGKTIKLISETNNHSHFQKAIIKFTKYLIFLALGLISILFLILLYRHEPFIETLQFTLVLVVASIPVALPSVLTVTMAVGASKLVRKKIIVSKLSSIEEMAGMDVLCSDKTGTLTKNELMVNEIFVLNKNNRKEEVIVLASLASKFEDNDSIDKSILNKLNELKLNKRLNNYNIVEFVPFDPVKKHTESIVEIKDLSRNKFLKIIKGAPQVIINFCDLNDENKDKIIQKINEFAENGFRTIAVAQSKIMHDLTKIKRVNSHFNFVGLIALYDPPRDDSVEMIKTAEKDMNVDIKMITGDHIAIAKYISKKLNLGNNIIEASKLRKQHLELKRIVDNADGFAEVFPEDKYKIIEVLQSNNHIVGMTGDGVNDAPALKKADVGIAVFNSTDAAKSASDLVLTTPGLSGIIDAIKESRKIFQRMQSYAIFRITETIRVLFFIALSMIFFNFYPINSIMILLLALLNDAPIMAIAYDNVNYSKKPEKWNIHKIIILSTILGFVGVISSFLILFIARDFFKLDLKTIQTFIFLKLIVAGHLTIYITRTKKNFWKSKPSNILLTASLITTILATIFSVYGIFVYPIGWKLSLFIWIYALIAVLITDFIKIKTYEAIEYKIYE